MTKRNAVADAQAALAAAEQKLAAAAGERYDAVAQLEAALVAAGWRRVVGGFSPGATPVYENAAGETFPRAAALEYELSRAA